MEIPNKGRIDPGTKRYLPVSAFRRWNCDIYPRKTPEFTGLKDHDEIYFVCTSAIKEEVTEVIGASNTIPRGRDFADFLKERLKTHNNTTIIK